MGNYLPITNEQINLMIEKTKKLSKDEFYQIAYVLFQNKILIKKYISQGFFGVVFEAILLKDNNVDQEVEERFAVKVLKFKDESEKNTLLKEIDIQKKFNKLSNQFISIKNVFFKNNLIAIVMDLAENSLKDQMKKDIDIQNKLEIINNLLRSLTILKKEKILHSDIKPDNILLDKKNYAKLSDFGLSKILDIEKSYTTKTDGGTFKYQPLEFMNSGNENTRIGSKSDIYSTGIVFLELLGIEIINVFEILNYKNGNFKVLQESDFKCQLEYSIYKMIITQMINPQYDDRGNIYEITDYFNQITQGLKIDLDQKYFSYKIVNTKQQFFFTGPSYQGKSTFLESIVKKKYEISKSDCFNVRFIPIRIIDNDNNMMNALCFELSCGYHSYYHFLDFYQRNSDSIVFVFDNDRYSSLQDLDSCIQHLKKKETNKNLLQLLCLGENKQVSKQEELEYSLKHNLSLTKAQKNIDEFKHAFKRIYILSDLYTQYFEQNSNGVKDIESYYEAINIKY